jgi:predicted TIM-barrel fold metal-dependent hydrolase
MIGSDWPVCTLAADYGRTMAVVADYVERLSPSMHNDGNVVVPSGLSAEGAMAAPAFEHDTLSHLRLEALSESERDQVLGLNAQRCWRLEAP